MPGQLTACSQDGGKKREGRRGGERKEQAKADKRAARTRAGGGEKGERD